MSNCRFQNGWVFGRSNEDRAWSMGAADGEVVGLGAASGEHDLAAGETGGFGQDTSGVVQRLARLPSAPVRCGRIGVLIGEPRQHRFEHFGAKRRRCCMIQVGGHVAILRFQGSVQAQVPMWHLALHRSGFRRVS